MKLIPIALLTSVLTGGASGAEPFLEKLDLFKAGDGGFKLYHIPGIVVTAKGTVLAWGEARKKGGDWDDIRILFCNPHNLERADGKAAPGKNRDRRNLSVKLSYDEGRTWPVNRTVEAGPSMYSDIAVTKAGTILCFYGRGTKDGFAGEALTLARFNLEWLTDGRGQRAK
jgi:hypothetical protein